MGSQCFLSKTNGVNYSRERIVSALKVGIQFTIEKWPPSQAAILNRYQLYREILENLF
jgi:hypothetical protein